MRALITGIVCILLGIGGIVAALMKAFPTDTGWYIGIVVGALLVPAGGYSIIMGVMEMNKGADDDDEDRPRKRKGKQRDDIDEEEMERWRERGRRDAEEEEEEQRPRPKKKRPRDED
jgi:hypothetical protein